MKKKAVTLTFVYNDGTLRIIVEDAGGQFELARYVTTDLEGFTKSLVSNGGGVPCHATLETM